MPELRGRLYVADDGEVCSGALGTTCPSLCFALEDRLQAEGRWRGPRPAIALNFPGIRRKAAEEGLNERQARQLTVAIGLHELGHVAERLQPGGDGLAEPAPLPPSAFRRAVIKFQSER